MKRGLNSLPTEKILDQSKLKAFADNKIYVTEKMKIWFQKEKSVVAKGENAGDQHFLFFPQCFQRLFFHVRLEFRVRIHQPFSRTFFVFVSKICKFECNTTSDWLNRTV